MFQQQAEARRGVIVTAFVGAAVGGLGAGEIVPVGEDSAKVERAGGLASFVGAAVSVFGSA